MTSTMKSRKTLTALGVMDGLHLQAINKLKQMLSWAEKNDPKLHEKVQSLLVILINRRSIVTGLMDSFREFDFDQVQSISEAIADVVVVCQEVQNLEVPRKMQIDSLKDALTERTSHLGDSRWAQTDPTCENIRQGIKQLESAQ